MLPALASYLAWNPAWAWQASCRATTGCVRAFSAPDFRQDLPRLNVPPLFIHGSGDPRRAGRPQLRPALNYDLPVSAADPAVLVLYESWRSDQDRTTHFQTPHVRDFAAKVNDLLAEAMVFRPAAW